VTDRQTDEGTRCPSKDRAMLCITREKPANPDSPGKVAIKTGERQTDRQTDRQSSDKIMGFNYRSQGSYSYVIISFCWLVVKIMQKVLNRLKKKIQ